MDPDLKIVRRAKRGERRAFEKLVKKYQDQILALAYDHLGNYEEARDTAQDVFMKVFSKLDGFEEKARFSTWLYRVTVNHCIDIRRKHERHKSLLERETGNLEQMPESLSAPLLIDLKLVGLSDAQRTALVMRYYQDMSIQEIGEVMTCSPATVRTHIYRALSKLRVYMEQPE